MKDFILFTVLALVGCAAQGEDAKPVRETYTNALLRVDTSIKGLAETQGNQTAELEAIKGELSALKAEVAEVAGEVAEVRKLLSVDTEISIEVPKAADPPTANASQLDAPPAEAADRRTVTLNGKPLDVAAVIKANYRRRWSHPGTIDSHLAEHGVAGFSGLDDETKERLHSALHEMGQAPAKAVTKSRTVYRAPVVLPQNCPNGRCPSVQYGYQSSRLRLFGRR